jgi:excisionase family DNA binding protein
VSVKKNYSLKPIRLKYTYTVYEIADLFGITPDTVFRWIRNEGLKRIMSGRQYLVYGSSLAKFLDNKNQKRKKPCLEGEIFCCKCQLPREPIPSSINPRKEPNRTIRVFGKCPVCNTRINKIVSGKKWSKSHVLYPKKIAPTITPNGEQDSQCKCQSNEEGQLCLNLTQ